MHSAANYYHNDCLSAEGQTLLPTWAGDRLTLKFNEGTDSDQRFTSGKTQAALSVKKIFHSQKPRREMAKQGTTELNTTLDLSDPHFTEAPQAAAWLQPLPGN